MRSLTSHSSVAHSLINIAMYLEFSLDAQYKRQHVNATGICKDNRAAVQMRRIIVDRIKPETVDVYLGTSSTE